MTDSFVQVAPDSTGKQVDAQTIPNALGVPVYRQTVTVGDPNTLASVQAVQQDGTAQVNDPAALVLLAQILAEMQVNSYFLSVIAGTREDPALIRADMLNLPQ